MKSLRCLIVDDERLARVSMRALLENIPDAEVAGEADCVESAVRAVAEYKPDVLLLDVQMPGGGGFAVLEALAAPPAVIFVTAYDQYALRAFDVNAVDYLLKPVEPERLREALKRVIMMKSAETPGTPAHVGSLAQDDLVLLELGGSGHFRRLNDVLAVEAAGKYTNVSCSDGRQYLVRQSMNTWEKRLPDSLFTRLDRGILINHKRIRKIDFLSRSATVALTGCRRKLILGRCAAAKLRRIIAG